MKQDIAEAQSPGGVELKEGQDWTIPFELTQGGFAELELNARSESDWRVTDYESVVVRIWLQEEYNQDCVLFYGSRPLEYRRLLGRLEPGRYTLRFEFQRELSSPQVTRAWIDSVRIALVPGESPMHEIYRHAPVLYGRNVYHPYESRYTDTPLLMFYFTEPLADGRAIEYQIMFSHEDEGTPTPLLMSKWGRTTDIEWVYRVELNEAGEVRKATFQGPHHMRTEFAGGTALGGHPVLQAATTNGMVDHTVTSAYRFLFPPVYAWDQMKEPRERVMDAFPFTYQVTAWEMERQYPAEKPTILNTYRLGDLRNYLYVQTAKITQDPQQKTSIDVQVKLKDGGWYSSSFGDLRQGNFRCAYDGPYAQFSTTVRLPEGTDYEDIEEICAVWLPGGEESVTVPELKALFLDEDYAPLPPIRAARAVVVTKAEPRQTMWRRGTP
ncbi:hypothetical protein MJA45_02920 [Paenibacillus aurantius]|uniref:Uncharacterized protein n=1 Tax=Paenibacillus aurantius TaxID=2918900 RepID=A0AA96RIC1_9BACL|nr:hypothetical protein [Paenibacillus aurantius]WNQ12029.1 hypothetical protein MJA45_02920 [Paenibacillus aurantius]